MDLRYDIVYGAMNGLFTFMLFDWGKTFDGQWDKKG